MLSLPRREEKRVFLLLLLTARDVEVARLLVEREQREVHRARARQGHPDAVQHVAVGEHADVEIGLEQVTVVSFFIELRYILQRQGNCTRYNIPVGCCGTVRSSRS